MVEIVEVSSDSNTSTNFSMSRNGGNCARYLVALVLLIRFRAGYAGLRLHADARGSVSIPSNDRQRVFGEDFQFRAPKVSVRPASGFTIDPPQTPTPMFNKAFSKL